MKRENRNILFYLLLILPLTLAAQNSEYSFNILRTPYSSRAAALGGNNISVIEDDITMGMHNPALLANVSDNTASLSYMTYMSDSKIAGAMFGKVFGEHSSGAISARYIDYGEFDGYTEDNIHTGTFRAKDMDFSLSYCYLLSERWSGGVTGRFLYSKYAEMSSIALGVDLGVNYYNPNNEFSLSFVIKNLGGQVKAFEEKHEKMPIDLQLGFTKRLAHAPILISLTMTNLHRWDKAGFYNADGSEDSFGELLLKHLYLGADFLLGKNFYASLGYNYRAGKELSTDGNKWDGLTAGAGLHIKRIKFGMSYSKLHVSSSSLLFNLSYSL